MGTNNKRPYSKYCRVFNLSLKECLEMPRLEFADKFGSKFKYMSSSKFKRTLEQIANAFEKGHETLDLFK